MNFELYNHAETSFKSLSGYPAESESIFIYTPNYNSSILAYEIIYTFENLLNHQNATKQTIQLPNIDLKGQRHSPHDPIPPLLPYIN